VDVSRAVHVSEGDSPVARFDKLTTNGKGGLTTSGINSPFALSLSKGDAVGRTAAFGPSR